MKAGDIVVIASVFYFSIVDKHAKIICTGTAKRSLPNQEAANVQEMCVCVLLWLDFTGTVSEEEQNHKFK